MEVVPEGFVEFLVARSATKPFTTMAKMQTLGKPLACAPMIVTVFFALKLRLGVYCFTARWRTSSSPSTVARGYSRTWHVGILCSVTAKCCSAIAIAFNGLYIYTIFKEGGSERRKVAIMIS